MRVGKKSERRVVFMFEGEREIARVCVALLFRMHSCARYELGDDGISERSRPLLAGVGLALGLLSGSAGAGEAVEEVAAALEHLPLQLLGLLAGAAVCSEIGEENEHVERLGQKRVLRVGCDGGTITVQKTRQETWCAYFYLSISTGKWVISVSGEQSRTLRAVDAQVD